MARRAHGFDMEIHGFGNFWPEDIAARYGVVRHDTVESLFAAVDIISPHTKLTKDTHHLINRDRLALMPQGSYVVNTGRGELADSTAILEALESGKLAGYGTDVMEEEPPPADHPLLSHPKVIVTAHIGSRTFESVPRQAKKSLDNLLNFLSGTGPVACANGVIPSGE
jgi:D-3-phosphoglycerate dehydrogenase